MTTDEGNCVLRERGRTTIDTDQPTGTLIPLAQDGVVFRQMFEYPVSDFVAEVGFYSEVMGFPNLALTGDYALFTYPDGGFCLSFRLDPGDGSTDLRDLKLLFMTADIDAAESHLRQHALVDDLTVKAGSPSQRVLHLSTPSGLPVEIWEFPTS